ncbi:MAG: DUF4335 domain-containing protein [Cyanobacteriota bacterium]|nr:DUF4335 domain-containing protein [Cyanobacteriota bacterium]
MFNVFKEKILRRYTPPTCTLELWGKPRPLSPASTLPPQYRFQLHFDDPRLSEDEQTTLAGDQRRLPTLADLVRNYTQSFLQPAFDPQGFNRTSAPELSLGSLNLLAHRFEFPGWSDKEALTLTTTQLFDLSQALEAWQADVRLQEQSQAAVSPSPRKNLQTAAALLCGALLLAGGGLAAWRFRLRPVPVATAPTPPPRPFLAPGVAPPVPPPPQNLPAQPPRLGAVLGARDPLPAPVPAQPATPPPRNPNLVLVAPPPRELPPIPPAPAAPQAQTVNPPPSQTFAPLEGPAPQANLPILPIQGSPLPNFQGQTLAPPPDLPALPPAPNPQIPLETRPLTAPPASNQNLLDTIPQVSQVRDYYQKNWQPPEALAQTLEYRLQLKPDGSLGEIIPLGKAARLYLAQLPQPQPGEAFVAPLIPPDSPLLRLVLTRQGTVQTFLED